MAIDFDNEMAHLESAEEFLRYFQIDFEPQLIRIKRIQLMRLFRHILMSYPTPWRQHDYKKALKIAYRQLLSGNELAFSPANCNGCSDCDD